MNAMRGVAVAAVTTVTVLAGLAAPASAQVAQLAQVQRVRAPMFSPVEAQPAKRAPAAAARISAPAPSSPFNDQRLERQFLRQAATNLRFEGEASKLALAKSGNGQVREVAAALLNHANATQPEMLHLLHSRGMAMPMLGSDESRVMRQLAKLSGAKFDRVYLDEVAVRTNQIDAVQYERVGAVTRDAQLHSWIERHLATVRMHLALATRALPGEPARVARHPPPTAVMGASPAVGTPAPRVPAPRT